MPEMTKLYLIMTKSKSTGQWENPCFVTWTKRRLTFEYETCEGHTGPDSFRAYDVVNNKGVRF